MPMVEVSNGGTPTFTQLVTTQSITSYSITSRHKAIIVIATHYYNGTTDAITCTNSTRVIHVKRDIAGSSTLSYAVFTDFTSDNAVINYSYQSGNYPTMSVIAVD